MGGAWTAAATARTACPGWAPVVPPPPVAPAPPPCTSDIGTLMDTRECRLGPTTAIKTLRSPWGPSSSQPFPWFTATATANGPCFFEEEPETRLSSAPCSPHVPVSPNERRFFSVTGSPSPRLQAEGHTRTCRRYAHTLFLPRDDAQDTGTRARH